MRTDKKQAFALRRQGKSYNEISKSLGMSTSTLSKWFNGVDFSDAIKAYLSKKVYETSASRLVDLNATRGALLRAHYEQAEREALSEMQIYIKNPLFVSAVSVYWGEGDKIVNGQVRIINTDPRMIFIFRRFLVEICNVPEEKLKGALYIYQDLDEATCKEFWIKNTGLTNFHKTMVLPSRHKTKKVKNGMCSLIVSSTYLKRKMLIWIDRLPQMVLNT